METVLESFSPRPGPLDSFHRQFMGIVKFHRVDGEGERDGSESDDHGDSEWENASESEDESNSYSESERETGQVGCVSIKATSLKTAEPFVLRSTAALAVWYVGP
jgi:hypothetical protein